ncbi:hypothetical protein [Curtobacterium sp. MCBD17_003]|uniref:hypothetical protein n=1 Tax=Curtobacterium sp. MCBD17_003 TaxID=2175667 RepID=UPI0011B5A7D0|nr:hypothetical protein [Curtobacterium sp. MCBD17_003]WIE55388.1 hypothetical protein DEI88_004040 [Curtobacterium sp. MCBD17_003]
MRVVVEVPERVLFALTDRAEDADLTVAEYLLRAGLTIAGVTESRQSTVARLQSLGLSDAAIAQHLNTTTTAVASMRRQLHLPANRRFPGRTKGHAA